MAHPRRSERVRSRGDAFDADYYARFYGDARTRVHGAAEIARLCRGITSMLAWWKAPLRSVLDVGAGPGLWRDWFAEHKPKVRYRSTDASRHACVRYRHELRDITRWRARERFDLIVCQGVLQYLDDAGCARAIENLAAMSRGLLYLEVITRNDLREVIDADVTDLAIHARTGAWYRKRLEPHFQQVGAGLWLRRGARPLFYELERAR